MFRSILRRSVCISMGLIAGFPPLVLVADEPTNSMEPYRETISHTEVSFDMVPIPGGEFVMGSPTTEAGRKPDEGPQHTVRIEPFWMGKTEVTWEEFDTWTYNLDGQRRKFKNQTATPADTAAELLTRPTKRHTDMTFGMGQNGFPAICMTQHAAKKYCEWLTTKTGHYYRLPTEAEWEYACRAGTSTAYSFGDDKSKLGEYAWFYDNSQEKYHRVGKKKPNPWGLFDMHGNVAEWCLDKYDADFYQQFEARTSIEPLCIPSTEYPRVVRGGSWEDDPENLRSAARTASSEVWRTRDPNIPKSVWYLTDAPGTGFRVIRPLNVPNTEERKVKTFDAILPTDARENNRKND